MDGSPREECRCLVEYLFGSATMCDFDSIPTDYGAERSCLIADSLRARVFMAPDASALDWLHEVTHYLSWLWSDHLKKDDLTEVEIVRAEIAAYLPIVRLADRGSPMARKWLAEAYPTITRRARDINLKFPQTSLRDLIRRVLDGKA